MKRITIEKRGETRGKIKQKENVDNFVTDCEIFSKDMRKTN
jgi:hypothetical protein